MRLANSQKEESRLVFYWRRFRRATVAPSVYSIHSYGGYNLTNHALTFIMMSHPLNKLLFARAAR